MQFKFFNIPVNDLDQSGDELNKFLRSHRVLEVKQKLIKTKNNAGWYFTVKYLESSGKTKTGYKSNSIDYKEVLDEKTFAVYSRLREIRKTIAEAEGMPVYAVFTNKELADVASLPEITLSALNKVDGIGEKKAERFGKKMLEVYFHEQNPNADPGKLF